MNAPNADGKSKSQIFLYYCPLHSLPDLLRLGGEKLYLFPFLFGQTQSAPGNPQIFLFQQYLHYVIHLHLTLPARFSRPELRRNPLRDFCQALYQERVKRAARPIQNHPYRLFMRKRRLIAPLAGQRVIDVRQGYNLGGDRNVFAPQAIGIAPPVIPLWCQRQIS